KSSLQTAFTTQKPANCSVLTTRLVPLQTVLSPSISMATANSKLSQTAAPSNSSTTVTAPTNVPHYSSTKATRADFQPSEISEPLPATNPSMTSATASRKSSSYTAAT